VAAGNDRPLPSLWQMEQDHEKTLSDSLNATMEQNPKDSMVYKTAEDKLNYLQQRREWLQQESSKIRWMIMPLLSSFHWEDDAGGQRAFNHYVPWWQLTRINGKDLLAALIFGVRISIVVGMTSVLIALIIGVPIGALAGFYGGKFDIVVSRLLEIWESMPAFFMLLMVVAILQSKSIFLVIAAIGLFGWTSFSRYVRGEFFKQRNLPYVEAGRALGFRDGYIIFKHILPNAIPPVLALMPFAIMGAITAEAGLSFLGLGEEGSTSWGVLMDEGRSAFPEDSFLLWPPATLLTIFLVAIALVGDDLRDALDPKLQR
jgi:peptide/nickel transport system permease protein